MYPLFVLIIVVVNTHICFIEEEKCSYISETHWLWHTYVSLWVPCPYLEFGVHWQEFLGMIISSCISLPDISLWQLVHIWFAHGEVRPQAWPFTSEGKSLRNKYLTFLALHWRHVPQSASHGPQWDWAPVAHSSGPLRNTRSFLPISCPHVFTVQPVPAPPPPNKLLELKSYMEHFFGGDPD